MKALVKILLTQVALCAIYLMAMSLVNGFFPFQEHGYASGMTCYYGLVALFGSLFATMILAVYLRPFWLSALPVAVIVWFWVTVLSGMPYRSLAFMALSLGLFAIHLFIVKRILANVV